ncbi:MAG: dihydrofolate reductase family protein [Nocardioides sp.]|uniref:dihydrofolate reductase family protein n=1 Tax=Nocardioides sp. TaxID=35761 RepID=UPI0039E504AB
MRTLIGGTDTSDPIRGAYPWPEGRPWLRMTMLRGLDGGVTGADNRSGSVSSEADRDLMAEIRRLADVVLIGAATMRIERYGAIKAAAADAADRRADGLGPAPTLAIVSASLDLPWTEAAFGESAVTPIVITSDLATPDALARAEEHAEVVRLPGEAVSAAAIVAALHERGLTRINCEGGPVLLASFAAEDLVDEFDLTVSPRLPTYGPTTARAGADAAEPAPYDLVQLVEHESFLFARYVRTGCWPGGTAAGS